ncbi:disease resistance-like protein CSA1 [Prunus yedoensis var. nudiflora]|uniref:Disease resistance-like protein CSA1 n=1 Tax=Prunus yedoensis var. nudiflora TaxID=2094558 RepID=A0A314XKP9_PRUYE|nr:disease resistance-like protein CSA1 [Prunus yedoensis var. nudiflora]
MGDAQLRIMRMAIASSKFKEDKIEEAYDSYYANQSNKEPFFATRCCGNKIPKWFSHKSEGCSIKIELPLDWFSTDFLGFALSLVVSTDLLGFALSLVADTTHFVRILCKYNFKTSNGESHEVNHPLYCLRSQFLSAYVDPQVFVWWDNNVFEEVVKGAESPTAFYELVTEVNVDFTVWSPYGYPKGKELEVKKCGICLLYGKDAEMIKQRALYAQDF